MTRAEHETSLNSGFASLDNADLLEEILDNFKVCIPLKRWLAFFEDNDIIIIFMKQELILQCAGDELRKRQTLPMSR